ncbi:MAG: hypothetical protein M3357_19965 [Actinomycetota bacterium]|nr:hypothetical protein [Actinomycetota bacterium]
MTGETVHRCQNTRRFPWPGLLITDVYDFAGVGTVVGVGGGLGWRTIEILDAHPTMRGILFDRPGTAEHARVALAEAASPSAPRWWRAASSTRAFPG